MQDIIAEKKASPGKISENGPLNESDLDQEMQECLTRLKVWQTENLMAPHGMNKFAKEMRRKNISPQPGKDTQ